MLASCNPSNEHSAKYPLFGVVVDLHLSTADQALAKRALNAVAYDLALIDEFTNAQTSKPLSRVNALLQSGEWFSVNPSLYKLTLLAREYSQQTEGAFNPVALGAMRQAWGYHRPTPTPDLNILKKLLQQNLGMNDIETKGIRMRGTKKELKLDFDLLALGYAIDGQLEHLQELGIAQASLTIGPITGNRGAQTQTIPIGGQHQVSLLPGEAVCRFSASDSRFPDLGRIDPRSAWPVKPVPSIVVINESARTASVACAVLSVANEDEWDTLVQRLGLRYVWWRQGEHERMTAALRSRLQSDKTGKERQTRVK